MEIHPPTKPVESVKDFLIHLSMITIGILIALGLEQAVESWHHHELGQQAQENILSEIRGNKKGVDRARVVVKENREALLKSLTTVRQLIAHEKLKEAPVTIKLNAASLTSTSWTTAQSTGALGYLGYGKAQKFAKAYEAQTLLQRIQDEEIGKVSEPFALVSFTRGGAASLNDDQLRTVEHDLIELLAMATLWDQMASELSQEYDHAVQEH
jgi:hypothetical protein